MRFACLLLFTLLLCMGTFLKAQQTEIPVLVNTLVPVKGIYRFSNFSEGSIVFRNGIITGAKMNYNISLDEIHFVGQNGDTLAVAEPATVSFINLNGSRFYYYKGYIQTIENFNGIILGFKQVLITQQLRKEEYGRVTAREGVRAYSFFTGNGQQYRLGEDDEIKVSAKEFYFFGDAYGQFAKSGKAWLYHRFPKHTTTIKEFLKTQHTNFNRLEDLLEVLKFCRQLK